MTDHVSDERPVDCVGEMTPERAIYFLSRFKNDEKMLGPHEQWALDYCIRELQTRRAAAGGVTDEMVERATRFEYEKHNEGADYDAEPESIRKMWTDRNREILTAALTAEPQAVEPVETAAMWRDNVQVLLSSGDPDVIRCHEGGGPESVIGSLVLTMMRTRNSRDKALAQPQPAAVPDYKAMFEDAVEKYNVQLARADRAEAALNAALATKPEGER